VWPRAVPPKIVVWAALAACVAGCATDPSSKNECRFSSDCDNGRVCVASHCREPVHGLPSPDAAAGVTASSARDAGVDRPTDAQDAAAKPEVAPAADAPAPPPDVLPRDAPLKRDAPPKPDSMSDLPGSPVDAALDIPVPPVEPPDAAPPADLARDIVVPPDLAADRPPDTVDLGGDVPPDVAPDLPPDVSPDLPPDLAPDVAPPVCGDGVVQFTELCDDGNQIDDDACTNDCTSPRCGDGVTQVGEDCDDGNASADDRCTPQCKWVPFTQIEGARGFCGLRTNGLVTCWSTPYVPPPSRFSHISSACGVRTDGNLQCWGDLPAPPPGSYQQVANGFRFGCALATDGAIKCWGDPGTAAQGAPAGKFVKVAAGEQSACAIRNDGQLLCWGSSPFALMGVPTTGSFVDVSVAAVGCATTSTGTISCWGIPPPTDPGFPGPLHGLVMGDCFGCGIRPDGVPMCWDDTAEGCSPGQGQLGPPVYTQIAVSSPARVCGIRQGGTISCGFPGDADLLSPTAPATRSVRRAFSAVEDQETWSALGNDGRAQSLLFANGVIPPMAFEELAQTASVAGCGLGSDHRLTCWKLGDTFAQPTGTYRQVVAGAYHVCALDSQGNVGCWADPGLETLAGQTTLLQPPLGPFTRLAAGRFHTCGLRPEGSVACWGGLFAPGQPPSPRGPLVDLPAPPPGPFVELDAGSSETCARRPSGAIVCWGPGDLPGAAAPQGLHGLSVGKTIACGLDATGEIRCWGNISPWKYFPRGPFRTVTAAEELICGLRRNGEVNCFGPEGPLTNAETLP
jgi:cysteine-rich repeat protein